MCCVVLHRVAWCCVILCCVVSHCAVLCLLKYSAVQGDEVIFLPTQCTNLQNTSLLAQQKVLRYKIL